MQRLPRLIALLMLALTPLAQAAPLAYVPNEKSASISIIDIASDRQVGLIPVGGRPRGIAAGGGRLYLSDGKLHQLLIVNLASLTLERRIDLGKSPEGLSLSANGTLLAVAIEDENRVALLRLPAAELLASMPVTGKNPEHAVFSPDGRWLYVSAEDAEQLDVIDVAAHRQVASIPVGKRPRGIAFLPDGRLAYVACELSNKVYAIDVGQQRVVAEIPVGDFPNGVVAHPDGQRVFISNGRSASVMAIDTRRQAVVASIPVGKRPWNMAITPDGRKLYVANGRSGTVSVLALDSAEDSDKAPASEADRQHLKHLGDIPVGELPWGVAIVP